jgi:predicted CXXCH cytochrome family protein
MKAVQEPMNVIHVKVTWYLNKLLKLNIISFVMFFPLFWSSPESVHSFVTPEEHVAHTKGASACATQQCHSDLASMKGKIMHRPVAAGECAFCHKSEAYPNKYGLDNDQRIFCGPCHKDMTHEIQSSTFIHSPITSGSCTACHAPHQSEWPFLLKQSYNELCSSCHKTTKLFTGVIHKPVRDGNCGICHDPHASNFKHRLTDEGTNLCLVCHEDMISGMSQQYVHAPLMESGCSSCHDPHAGEDAFRLKAAADRLCFTCHDEKWNEVTQNTQKHLPALEGKCTSCHSPHYSDSKYLLRDKVDVLCYKCHEDSIEWKERRYLHGPVVQGNCTACHNPHGSDNAFILRSPFPHKFYSEYKRGKYSLCFLCHKEALVTAEKTEVVTNFRNGDINLHTLHVHQKKGRTCRACHDVHASNQEGRIRDEFPFGKMSIPLEYSKTQTGGSCIPGCHRERSYDRVNKVRHEEGK